MKAGGAGKEGRAQERGTAAGLAPLIWGADSAFRFV